MLTRSVEEISKHVKLMTSPRKFRVPQGISNGVLKMLIACYHKTTSLTPFFIGGNEADWSDLPEVAEIRRQDRDYRLQRYIPLTKEAYRALREVEHAVAAQQPLGQGASKLDEARMEAVKQMRRDQRFLGRTSEVGQAFNANNLKAHQCCYPCQGMMGYITPAAFKPAKKGHT